MAVPDTGVLFGEAITITIMVRDLDQAPDRDHGPAASAAEPADLAVAAQAAA